jgi:hypothetical protein
MKRLLLIGLIAVLAVSTMMAAPSSSWAHGGWGAGWFVGGLALGTAVGVAAARPYYYPYYPPPYYYYPPPAYAYPPPAYSYPQSYVYQQPAPSQQTQAPPAGEGQWVNVPGQEINGTWVPEHKVWVPKGAGK